MRQEMSRVNKLILALPDQSHVQLVPLLPEMFNKPALLGNQHNFKHPPEMLSDIT